MRQLQRHVVLRNDVICEYIKDNNKVTQSEIVLFFGFTLRMVYDSVKTLMVENRIIKKHKLSDARYIYYEIAEEDE